MNVGSRNETLDAFRNGPTHGRRATQLGWFQRLRGMVKLAPLFASHGPTAEPHQTWLQYFFWCTVCADEDGAGVDDRIQPRGTRRGIALCAYGSRMQEIVTHLVGALQQGPIVRQRPFPSELQAAP